MKNTVENVLSLHSNALIFEVAGSSIISKEKLQPKLQSRKMKNTAPLTFFCYPLLLRVNFDF